LVAAIGIYGVSAFEVARRQFEMGVRLSLGATAADLRRMMIRAALKPVAVGAGTGLAISWWAASFLQSFVVDVDARDPGTFAVVAVTLALTAIAAAWLPAGLAARTNPASILRN
jgi:ABC-type antimicrobial peptide transport system permease subunit